MKKFEKTNLSPSSKEWLKRQSHDQFVKLAKEQSYRSRAAYKLLQLNSRDNFLRLGQRVVDLGAAPGGWLQVIVQKVYEPTCNLANTQLRVFALDIVPITGMAGTKIILGDFHCEETINKLESELQKNAALEIANDINANKVDVVLSDLSHNISGVRAYDNARSEELWNSSLDFARRWLNNGGSFVSKMFQSAEAEQFVRECKGCFANVSVRKPEASRDKSREVFLVAKGFGKNKK